MNNAAALEAIEESWVAQHWHISLPVVVRRDVDANARIPVGVRGMKRDQRAAGWVQRENIVRTVSPEILADRQQSAALAVCFPAAGSGGYFTDLHFAWPWLWGITGSTGYALASEIPVLHADSDLDLLIRAAACRSLAKKLLRQWQAQRCEAAVSGRHPD